MKVILENNEKEVINRLKRTFRNDNYIPREKKTEVIEEGIKFFKTSIRLYKLADKIEMKSKKNPELAPTVKKLNELATKFDYAESLYDVGKKTEGKAQYESLKKKYMDLLKLLKKDDVKNALKKSGCLALTIASMVLPYMMLNKFFPSLSFGAVNSQAAKSGFKDQAALYLKRAGAFTLCGLPTTITRSGFNNAIDQYDDKVVKSVDRFLNSNSETNQNLLNA